MSKPLRPQIITAAQKLARSHATFQIGDVLNMVPQVSRQYVQPILKELVASGELIQAGLGRAAAYAAPQNSNVLNKLYVRRLVNRDLEEHIVFEQLKEAAPFINRLRENVFSIFDYSFQEMLNNAIDHSQSKTISIAAQQSGSQLFFEVRDSGVGIFANIQKKLGLENELFAIGELMKGKTTTDPENHTGEGVFFTSKAADVFIAESHGLKLRVDNVVDDIFVEASTARHAGTRIQFWVSAKSNRHLSDIFERYQTNPDDHDFNQTEIRVKLFTVGSVYVSRSQARRILSGLDKKFRTVILDFDKVSTIGQAFADEIFRVYRQKHPEMTIKSTNTCQAVQFMIDRAETR